MRFAVLKWLGLIVMALALSGCSSSTSSWKQKLTIEVETPGGLVSAFSVSKVKATYTPIGPREAPRTSYSLKGEAVVLEVAQGRYLFVLLGEDMKKIAVKVFKDVISEPDKDLTNIRQSLPIPRKLYPMLVTFANIDNPASVREVDPSNLSKSFGAGYRLKSITLEITDEKVTKGVVENVLGWIYDVDRIVPKENVSRYKLGERIPGLGDFIDWQTMRKKRSNRK